MVQYASGCLDASFAALSDATRRGVLNRLGRADASISELASGSTSGTGETFEQLDELLVDLGTSVETSQ